MNLTNTYKTDLLRRALADLKRDLPLLAKYALKAAVRFPVGSEELEACASIADRADELTAWVRERYRLLASLDADALEELERALPAERVCCVCRDEYRVPGEPTCRNCP